MLYARCISYLVLAGSLCFGGLFDNSTFYSSATMATPYVNDVLNLEDDYKYSFGIRKIALFPYQVKENFYKGSENQLSDNALFGAVKGLEYLFSLSNVRNQGHKFTDQEFWIKWSNNNIVGKFKYLDKGSRDLQFASADARFKFEWGSALFSLGGNIKSHPTYGHPAYNDYNEPWWFLAYDYGYVDYSIPGFDLNENGIIDDPYYVWIETDPDTEEGYWVEFYEGTSYYWEDPDGNQVAFSDAEFFQYHLPAIIHQYNEDNKDTKWQSEASVVVGLDFYFGNDKYYSHLWVNAFPLTVGLTEKSYNGDGIQYDIGTLVGVNLSEHIGVFIEGIKLSYYGREEYNISTGMNWRF